jgi:competence protein ComEC
MQYLCIGALIGLLIDDKLLYSSYFALYFFIVSSALVVFYFWKRVRERLKRVLVPSLLFSFAVTFFIVRSQFIEKERIFPESLYQKQNLTLTVKERKEENTYTRYTVSFPFEGKEYRAYVRADSYPMLSLGEKVSIASSLDDKEKVLVTESGESSFDYDAYLEKLGIAGVYSFPKIERTGEKEESFSLTLAKQRETYIQEIKKAIRSPEADLVSATLFGGDSLTKEGNQMYRQAGISHIVALSGFNITIIIAFLSVILYFLPFWLRFLVSISAISLYLAMVGVSGSLLRATIMAGISLLALARGNISSAKKVLLLSTLLLASFFPEDFVHDASLQLSLLAMYGVLFVYPAFFENFVEKKNGLGRLFYELFFITASVTLLVFPYTALVFHKAALYGLLSTVLVTPFVPVITILGIVFLMVPAYLSFLSGILAFILFVMASSVIFFAEIFSVLPYALFSLSATALFCFVYYSAMVVLVFFFSEKKVKDERGSTPTKNDDVIEGTVYF